MSDNLGNVGDFHELVRYLHKELGWPVAESSFDDLTFEYDPAEVGLKPEESAQVKKIHQLRPLESGQPWGIFFVEFDKKKLPVVVLRRILSHLVIKKRSTKADRAAWNAHDLLFISAFGEKGSDSRELAFAHFHQSDGDMPTLRVLGWDAGDTPLKLEHVAGQLREKLHWPTNPKDHAAWRAQWSRVFRHRIGYVIKTADALAERLATLARNIRERCKDLMQVESENGPLTKLFKAFRDALIHDLKPATFADTYAQTITYGLLTAAISRTDKSGVEGTALVADDLSSLVPVTNPFLKEMLETFLKVGGRRGGMDFDELGIHDVVELLRDRDKTDLAEVLRDFGNRNPDEDPVIHFYEHFLSAYDKPQKKQRGVFYTPQPVVSYIVRSVHELLQTEFGLEDGLASTVTWREMLQCHKDLKLPTVNDPNEEGKSISPEEPFVQILDPATGTATFLVEVIEVIFIHLQAKWNKEGIAKMPPLKNAAHPLKTFTDYWNAYVSGGLFPRLFGYELLAAPYAIAHMKMILKLSEINRRLQQSDALWKVSARVNIFLTNALEPKVTQLKPIAFEPLAHEARAVNEIKWYKRFTVIIGNPPYAGLSWNLTTELRKIIDPYRFIGDERIKERGALQLEKNLQDDYVKFVCFAEQRIKAAGVGISGLVTSHGFLDNVFLRGMRHSLLSSYDNAFVLDLHGNVLRGEKTPEGTVDQNVFDIKQTGVAISLFSRNILSTNRSLRHADLWGDRETAKTPYLIKNTFSSTKWTKLEPGPPSYLFVPRDTTLLAEYEREPSLVDAMPLRSLAVVTGRDGFVIDEDAEALVQRMTAFARSNASGSALDQEFGLRSSTWWSSTTARSEMPAIDDIRQYIRTLDYRPFDRRFCFYHGAVFESLRRPVMQHLAPKRPNVLLITTRMVKGENFAHAFVSNTLTEAIGLSSKTSNSAYIFPAYIYPDQGGLLIDGEKRGNFSEAVLSSFARAFGTQPSPAHIFNYAYAVLYSPSYRIRYAEFLKRDFPRLPLTNNRKVFDELAEIGGELVSLHLLESPKLDHPITEYISGRASKIEKVSHNKNTVWLDKAVTTGFKGVSEEVWNFHIGGYRVCEKWLKDRKGRQLSADDHTHYQRIIVALSETIRLMKEIDVVIEKHGGWPLK